MKETGRKLAKIAAAAEKLLPLQQAALGKGNFAKNMNNYLQFALNKGKNVCKIILVKPVTPGSRPGLDRADFGRSTDMELKNFDQIVERAKRAFRKERVVIAGADAENILRGAFEAQDAGFAALTLVGEKEKILATLDRIGLRDKEYRLVETGPEDNVTQVAIDLINRGEGDLLMRGNIQTREFLLPLLDKKNGLRTDRLLTHIDLVSMPQYHKLIAIGDVTVTIEPDLQKKKKIIQNMTETLELLGCDKPKLALLSLVEKVSFHMQDTIDAQELIHENADRPFANCQLAGPVAYDLIMSKEAARLKGVDPELSGEFDGIVVPNLLAGNLIVKGWQMHADAITCGIVVGAKIPVVLTSRSDRKEVSFLSLAFCAAVNDGRNLND